MLGLWAAKSLTLDSPAALQVFSNIYPLYKPRGVSRPVRPKIWEPTNRISGAGATAQGRMVDPREATTDLGLCQSERRAEMALTSTARSQNEATCPTKDFGIGHSGRKQHWSTAGRRPPH